MAKRRKSPRNPDHGFGLQKRQSASAQPGARPDSGEVYNLLQLNITWDALPEPAFDSLPEKEKQRMEGIFKRLHKFGLKPHQRDSLIQDIRECKARHPDVRFLENWLINTLRFGTTEQRAEAARLSEDLFQRMPDYFFARTNLAAVRLNQGRAEEAADLILRPECLPNRLEPERKLWHISEIRHWLYLCAKIKIMQGDPDGALSYRDLLAQLEPGCAAVEDLNDLLEGNYAYMTRLLTCLKSKAPL